MRGQWEELINETKDGKRYKSMRHGLSFMEEMDQLFTGRVATGVHAFSAAASRVYHNNLPAPPSRIQPAAPAPVFRRVQPANIYLTPTTAVKDEAGSDSGRDSPSDEDETQQSDWGNNYEEPHHEEHRMPTLQHWKREPQ